MKRALIVVDVQNDFVDGSLPVPNGKEVIPILNKYIEEFTDKGEAIFYSMCAHPTKHCSFVEFGGKWPMHCVMGTTGQMLADGLLRPTNRARQVVGKGYYRNADAYSAFDGTALESMLTELRITDLLIGGLATDYCVQATVLDACRLGFKVDVLIDAIRGVDKDTTATALLEMVHAGAKLINGASPIVSQR